MLLITELREFVPETFLIIIVVMAVIGYVAKQSGLPDKYIPLLLMILGGAAGVALALGSQDVDVLHGLFYGIICGGAPVGFHQIPKQLKKKE